MRECDKFKRKKEKKKSAEIPFPDFTLSKNHKSKNIRKIKIKERQNTSPRQEIPPATSLGSSTFAHLQEIDNVMQVLVQIGREGVVDGGLVVLLGLSVAEAFRVQREDGLDLAELEQEDLDLEQLAVLARHRVGAKGQLGGRGLQRASGGAKPEEAGRAVQ